MSLSFTAHSDEILPISSAPNTRIREYAYPDVLLGFQTGAAPVLLALHLDMRNSYQWTLMETRF